MAKITDSSSKKKRLADEPFERQAKKSHGSPNYNPETSALKVRDKDNFVVPFPPQRKRKSLAQLLEQEGLLKTPRIEENTFSTVHTDATGKQLYLCFNAQATAGSNCLAKALAIGNSLAILRNMHRALVNGTLHDAITTSLALSLGEEAAHAIRNDEDAWFDEQVDGENENIGDTLDYFITELTENIDDKVTALTYLSYLKRPDVLLKYLEDLMDNGKITAKVAKAMLLWQGKTVSGVGVVMVNNYQVQLTEPIDDDTLWVSADEDGEKTVYRPITLITKNSVRFVCKR